MNEREKWRMAVSHNRLEAKPLNDAAQDMVAIAARHGLSVAAGQFAAEMAGTMMLKSLVQPQEDRVSTVRPPYSHTRREPDHSMDPSYRPLCVHCPKNYNPYTTPEIIQKWKEQTGWRRFMHTFRDTENAAEAFSILEKHGLTQREVAVLVTTFHLGPGFTLDDFGQNDPD